jgi:hypothetical protein
MKRIPSVSIAAAMLAAAGINGCADSEPTGASPPVLVEVTSPIGSVMALGRSVQLSATARDVVGNVVTGVPFSWESSNEAVARVSSTGLVTGVAEGAPTITATAENVSGSLQMEVVAVDLDGIAAVLNDPFFAQLVSHLSGATKASMQAAMDGCSSGVTTGNLEAIQECILGAQSLVAAATDPDDKALLAVAGLFLDHAERLLDL